MTSAASECDRTDPSQLRVHVDVTATGPVTVSRWNTEADAAPDRVGDLLGLLAHPMFGRSSLWGARP